MIYLYNSLSRKKEKLNPIKKGQVGLYTCGPTVYNYQHIGNMRAYIIWDVLSRLLNTRGYKVTHIMNITDVGHLTSDADTGDDKMELAKERERINAWEVAKKYFDFFQYAIKQINILPPTKFVKATDLINDMIAFVKVLDKKGYLYLTSDGMYFDTGKDPAYGQLGKIKAGGLLSGARVELNPEKRNITDFAVWKFSPKGKQRDMEWDSPWGTGFPGWHLECSVISRRYLGDRFDIHCGGIDHLTVHHPNEMAQSKAVTGKQQANLWLHNNFINFQNKRISKSSGTFVRLADITAGGVQPLAFRFFVLQTHYRKQLAYSWDAIKAADQGLQNLYREISFYNRPKKGCVDFEEKFFKAVSDDLNTPKGLDIVQRLIKSVNPSSAKLASLFKMDEVLGLGIKELWRRRSNIPAAAMELLTQRKLARSEKNWIMSDSLRKKLGDIGVEVQDTKNGQESALSE